MKRALCISGGGSKGAFAGGVAEYLIDVEGKKYDMFIGSSTGAIIQTLLASGNIEKAKEGYTNIKSEDIWVRNPFEIVKDQNGVIKIDLSEKNIFLNQYVSHRLVFTKKFPFISIEQKGSTALSFGDASILRDTLSKFITLKDYNIVKDSDTEIIACVQNATTKEKEYKSSNDWGYEDFLDWVWASASAYPFMAPVFKNGCQYIDGGTLEPIPIQKAIELGATEIDVIVLGEESPKFKAENFRNLIHGILLTIDMIHSEIRKNDVTIGKLKALVDDVKINMYYTPRKLTNNSLVFNSEHMKLWWDEGFEVAKNKTMKTYEIVGHKEPILIFNGMEDD